MGDRYTLNMCEDIKDARNIILSSSMALALKDKYPKAHHHYIVTPINADIKNLYELSAKHIPLLQNMYQLSLQLILNIKMESNEFLIGFNRDALIKILVLHVISTDFISDCLKCNRDWTKFNKIIFLPYEMAYDMLILHGQIKPLTFDELVKGRTASLECLRCGYLTNEMSCFKLHLLKHWEEKQHQIKKHQNISNANDNQLEIIDVTSMASIDETKNWEPDNEDHSDLEDQLNISNANDNQVEMVDLTSIPYIDETMNYDPYDSQFNQLDMVDFKCIPYFDETMNLDPDNDQSNQIVDLTSIAYIDETMNYDSDDSQFNQLEMVDLKSIPYFDETMNLDPDDAQSTTVHLEDYSDLVGETEEEEEEEDEEEEQSQQKENSYIINKDLPDIIYNNRILYTIHEEPEPLELDNMEPSNHTSLTGMPILADDINETPEPKEDILSTENNQNSALPIISGNVNDNELGKKCFQKK